jgi:hypothetical protein
MWSISFEVLVAFRWWPSLAETCKGLIILLKTLSHLMEFNPHFTYIHRCSLNAVKCVCLHLRKPHLIWWVMMKVSRMVSEVHASTQQLLSGLSIGGTSCFWPRVGEFTWQQLGAMISQFTQSRMVDMLHRVHSPSSLCLHCQQMFTLPPHTEQARFMQNSYRTKHKLIYSSEAFGALVHSESSSCTSHMFLVCKRCYSH